VSSPDLLARLRAIPIFAGLPDDALERVAAVVDELEFPAGHVLIQPHEPGSGMFVLEDGTVTVELRGRTLELGPGEFVGELSLLVPGATRSGRVRAVTALRCLAVGRRELEELLESEPGLALAMLRALAARLLRET
jgi:CRP-like cAMP-binding protein